MRKFLLFFFLLALTISGCGPVTPAPTPPEKRVAGTMSSTTTFEIAQYPGLTPISSENVSVLKQIGKLGAGPILAVATSPDKTRIAVAIPGQINIYDVATLTQKQTILVSENKGYAPALLFSPDGQTLVFSSDASESEESGQSDSYHIVFWDLIGNTLKRDFASLVPNWRIHGIVFSPDGERLIVDTKGYTLRCDGAEQNLALYDLDGNLLFDQYSCSRYRHNSYGFTTDGKAYFLIMTELPRDFYLLDAKTGVLIESAHYRDDNQASETQKVLYRISPDGNILAYAMVSSQGVITELVDFRTRKILQTVNGLQEFFIENEKVNWRNIPPNPADLPLTPRLVLEKCNLVNKPSSLTSYELIVSNSKKAILSSSIFVLINAIELWDLTTCKVEKTISFPNTSTATFSPNGSWLATTDGYTAYVWSVETKKIRFSIPGKMFDRYNNLIQFNADSTRFLTSSRYNRDNAVHSYTISSFDTQTGKLVREIKSAGEELYQIKATPEKDIIIAVDSTGFHFWNIETGQLLSTLPEGEHAFDARSGQIWVAAKRDAELYQIVLLDYLTGNKIRELEPIQASGIRKLHLTETQKLMVLLISPTEQGSSSKVSMIDLQTNTVSDLSTAAPAYQAISFAQNIFATYNHLDNGYISLWNFEKNAPYLVLLGSHQNTTINDAKDTTQIFNARVQFLNENVLFVQGETTIRFWDTKKGILLSELKPDYKILDVAFSPNQQLLAVTGADGIIRLWGVPKP